MSDTPETPKSARIRDAVLALGSHPDEPYGVAPMPGVSGSLRRALVQPEVAAALRHRCQLRQTTTTNAFWRAVPAARMKGSTVVDCRDPETVTVTHPAGLVERVPAEEVRRWHRDYARSRTAHAAREWLRQAVRHPEWRELLSDTQLMETVAGQVEALNVEASLRRPCNPVFQD